MKKFRVWKTIKLGNFKNTNDLRTALKKNGFKVGDFGNGVLDRPTVAVSSEEKEIQLINISVSDLGFRKPVNYVNICDKARKLGLELCPNEVGPQLRLQYKDQPKGEYLHIAMEPIVDQDGDLRIFRVANRGNGLYLFGGFSISDDDLHNVQDRFVFCLQK